MCSKSESADTTSVLSRPMVGWCDSLGRNEPLEVDMKMAPLRTMYLVTPSAHEARRGRGSHTTGCAD